MNKVLLEVRGLTKSFGALLASDNVDLEVLEGETHAIIGPNGAGKTTLIGQLARALVPDHQHLRRFHRARERDARGAGARRLELSLLERCARRACAAGARAAGARGGGLGRARRVAGGEPRARRAASARDRDGARDAPAADAAR